VDRNFSSSATLLYKFIFPAIWIALCGLIVFQYSHLARPNGAFGNEFKSSLALLELSVVLLSIVGSVFFLRLSLQLLRV